MPADAEQVVHAVASRVFPFIQDAEPPLAAVAQSYFNAVTLFRFLVAGEQDVAKAVSDQTLSIATPLNPFERRSQL